ncbi:MAG TPA: PilZ domain-containing protein [Marinagarivorans sp.]
MEQYYPPDRILELAIGSVVQVNSESGDFHFTVSLVGVDAPHSVITTLPLQQHLPEGFGYDALFSKDEVFEMRTIHEGHVVAFEAAFLDTYKDRLLMTSFPEMIETRLLRVETRFPCALSCDIRQGDQESYGVIANISHGGCQLAVNKDASYGFIERSVGQNHVVVLEVFFPMSEAPVALEVFVRSAVCQVDGACKVGIAFRHNYEPVRRYLESLQLDSVAPFFR